MKIVTDSAADMPQEELESLGITLAPLRIQFPEETISSEDISPDQFYNRLRSMAPEIPTTSLPSSGMFTNIYRKLAEFKEEILSIHISSGLSGTIESARLGAKDVQDAHVTHWDTMTLSGGERFQVLAAAMAAKAGWSMKAIQERLAQIRAANQVVYTLDTLTYLAKGGRIGRVQALAGLLLHIKPVITVDKEDGKYNTVGKERTLNKALDKITDHLHQSFGEREPMWVTILHGQFEAQAENLANNLKQRMNIGRLETLRVSPVLGVHTGPGVAGAAVVPLGLFDGLI